MKRRHIAALTIVAVVLVLYVVTGAWKTPPTAPPGAAVPSPDPTYGCGWVQRFMDDWRQYGHRDPDLLAGDAVSIENTAMGKGAHLMGEVGEFAGYVRSPEFQHQPYGVPFPDEIWNLVKSCDGEVVPQD